MPLLYNDCECCETMQKDRTKVQMIGRLNVRQCDWKSGARPINCFIVKMLVRVRGGIYNARFTRSSVDIAECKRWYRPRRDQKQEPNSKSIVAWNRYAKYTVFTVKKELFGLVLFSLILLFLSVSGLGPANFNVSYYLSFTTILLGRIQDAAKPSEEANV